MADNPSLEESLFSVRRTSADLITKRENLKRKIQIENARNGRYNGSTANRYNLYQDQLKNLNGIINNLSSLEQLLEEAIQRNRIDLQKTIVQNCSHANALTTVLNIGNKAKLEDIRKEIREQEKVAKKISDLISKGSGEDSENEQLSRELDLILNKHQPQESPLDNLPSVPNTEPVLNTNSVRSVKGIQTETVSNQDLKRFKSYSDSTDSGTYSTRRPQQTRQSVKIRTVSHGNQNLKRSQPNSGSHNSGSTNSGSTNSGSYGTRRPNRNMQRAVVRFGLITTILGSFLPLFFRALR